MISYNKYLHKILLYNDLKEKLNVIKTIKQGLYIRDYKLKDILNILQDKLYYSFNFKEFDIDRDINENVYQNTHNDYDKFINIDSKNIDTKILSNHLINIDKKSNKITFFYVGIPLHVTGHCIIGNTVWIYDPHCYEYNYIKCFIDTYVNNGFIIGNLPKHILKQGKLNLCYMYVIHFFIVNLLKFNGYEYDYKNTLHIDNDIYISKITENIIDLLYRHENISKWNYYLLKNDILNMKIYIKNCNYVYIDIIEQLCNLINSVDMMLCIDSKIKYTNSDDRLYNILDYCVYNYNIYDIELYNFTIEILKIIIIKNIKLLIPISYIYVGTILDMNIDFKNISDINTIWNIYFNSIIQKNMKVYEKSMIYGYHTVLINNNTKEFFDYLLWYICNFDNQILISFIKLMDRYIDNKHRNIFLYVIKKLENRGYICV